MSSPVAVNDITMDDLGGHDRPGVIWDLDPNLTHEIYEDLGVEVLDKAEPKKIPQKRKNKKTPPDQKASSTQTKPAIVHTTPSPTAVRESAQNHIHNGQNCSCVRRIFKGNKDPGADPFLYLSDEVILSIFHWLPKKSLTHCAKVCRRWRRLSYDEELWRKVDLSSRNFLPGILGLILERGIVHAKLSRCTITGPVFDPDLDGSAMEEGNSETDDLNSSRMSSVSTNPLQLESLDLSACINDDPANIQTVLARCPSLRKLSLESCQLNGNALLTLAENGASLEVLDLAMCRLTNPEALTTLIRAASRLQSLNISWLGLSAERVKELITVLPTKLKHLNISGYKEKLKNKDVVTIVTRCHELKQLDLSDSTSLGYDAISAIVQNLPCLEHVSLSRCYDIPFYAFVSLIDISTLEALDVFGVMQDREQERLRVQMPKISINSYPFSSIARPTFSAKQAHHIWGVRCEVV
ncbi:S-phase kinase-associated protein 2-like [Lytechinus variegatus]|uniref:S-phase kinase-associated protein 2-like n=1 Tax=Lytechinus variegatus TaxID=7654 RepID=UPI001BB12BB2|nr:S-phase kinase-associated protein 2-like [Lytechinus variegatus]XP_041474975.1 S-phase kinase-associated protein 2-like [Lytechinus variegatus]